MRKKLLLLAWLTGLTYGTSQAHELEADRMTLVLRDQTHLSISLYINYTEALARQLLPGASPEAFVLEYAAMAPAPFAQAIQKAQQHISEGIVISQPGGWRLPLSHWVWPDTGQLHEQFQEKAMQLLVDPGHHEHLPIQEIHAEGVAGRMLDRISVQLPPALPRVLVVSYRPQQNWVTTGLPSPEIRF